VTVTHDDDGSDDDADAEKDAVVPGARRHPGWRPERRLPRLIEPAILEVMATIEAFRYGTVRH